MKRFLTLSLFLSASPAMAVGVCGEPEEGFFDLGPYIITEFNDPVERSLSVTYRHTLKKYEHCENGCWPLSEHNAYQTAKNDLWFELISTHGEIFRQGCGGEVRCLEPILAENVRCYVEKGDCDYEYEDPYVHTRILETYYLECRGDRSCTFEDRPAKDCCIITGRKVNPWKT
jgi:hypothetical protein